MTRSWRETSFYAAGAAAAFAVDVAILTVLVEVLSIQYLCAATISFVAGTSVVYWVSVTYAFRYRRIRSAQREFVLFAVIGAVGIAVNLGGMYASVELLGLHYLAGKILSAGITFLTNFAMRRALLFTNWSQD